MDSGKVRVADFFFSALAAERSRSSVLVQTSIWTMAHKTITSEIMDSSNSIIVHCLNCDQKLRVPQDKKKLFITCPNCQSSWAWSISCEDLFEQLERQGIKFPGQYRSRIQQRINDMLNYEPRIGVLGKTGAGKSSLCNALFGQDVCEINDVSACTRDPQEVFLSIGGQGLKIIDVPGVGESRYRDEEYRKLYQSLLPKLDLIFWVLKADDRAYRSDEDFYKEIIKPYSDAGKPFFIVLNQVDKIEPFREWNTEEKSPGLNQLKNINLKRSEVANFFNLPTTRIIPVSANEKYGLMELIDEVIYALPKEKKAIFLDKIHNPEETVSAPAQEEAKKAWWEVTLEVIREVADTARVVIDNLAEPVMKIIGTFLPFRWPV